MPYIVVLARRVGAEARLQHRNRLMYEVSWFHELWWTMKSGSLMLWTVKSPPAVYAQMKSRLCLTFGFVTLPRRFRLNNNNNKKRQFIRRRNMTWVTTRAPINVKSESWHRLRRGGVTFSKDSPKTRFTYLLYCNVFFSFASWSILDDVLLLFVVSALGVFQWPCSTVSGSV